MVGPAVEDILAAEHVLAVEDGPAAEGILAVEDTAAADLDNHRARNRQPDTLQISNINERTT